MPSPPAEYRRDDKCGAYESGNDEDGGRRPDRQLPDDDQEDHGDDGQQGRYEPHRVQQPPALLSPNEAARGKQSDVDGQQKEAQDKVVRNDVPAVGEKGSKDEPEE